MIDRWRSITEKSLRFGRGFELILGVVFLDFYYLEKMRWEKGRYYIFCCCLLGIRNPNERVSRLHKEWNKELILYKIQFLKNSLYFLLLFTFFILPKTQGQIITTIAGNGVAGYYGDGIAATNAELYRPAGIVIDGSKNVYIADQANHRVRKISAAGIITTIAGTGIASDNGDGGPATAAQLNHPDGVAVDAAGNVYIADAGSNRIRKINTSGIIYTIAGNGSSGYTGDGGDATSAQLRFPTGVAVDLSGNVYIADCNNNCIRMVESSGIITTIAGTGMLGSTGDGGPATAAELIRPVSILLDNSNNIYFSENSKVRKINAIGKTVSTIAGTDSLGFNGDGIAATNAKLFHPYGLAMDGVNNIYIADGFNNRIRKVDASGMITTIAGNESAGYGGDGGIATLATINNPFGIVVDSDRSIYFSDFYNDRIRRIQSTVAVNNINSKVSGISCYPNPSTGRVIVNISSGIDEQVNLSITNIVGDEVKETIMATNKPNDILIATLPGMYILTAKTRECIVRQKVIISAECQ